MKEPFQSLFGIRGPVFREVLGHMSSDIPSNFRAAVPIKHAVQRRAGLLRSNDMGVLHAAPPALHARRAVAESARLTVLGLFQRDGGAEVGAHLYLFGARGCESNGFYFVYRPLTVSDAAACADVVRMQQAQRFQRAALLSYYDEPTRALKLADQLLKKIMM